MRREYFELTHPRTSKMQRWITRVFFVILALVLMAGVFAVAGLGTAIVMSKLLNP